MERQRGLVVEHDVAVVVEIDRPPPPQGEPTRRPDVGDPGMDLRRIEDDAAWRPRMFDPEET